MLREHPCHLPHHLLVRISHHRCHRERDLATPLPDSSQPVDSTEPKKKVSLVKDYWKLSPHKFDGVKDPILVEHWLVQMEKLSEYMEYSREERVIRPPLR